MIDVVKHKKKTFKRQGYTFSAVRFCDGRVNLSIATPFAHYSVIVLTNLQRKKLIKLLQEAPQDTGAQK